MNIFGSGARDQAPRIAVIFDNYNLLEFIERFTKIG